MHISDFNYILAIQATDGTQWDYAFAGYDLQDLAAQVAMAFGLDAEDAPEVEWEDDVIKYARTKFDNGNMEIVNITWEPNVHRDWGNVLNEVENAVDSQLGYVTEVPWEYDTEDWEDPWPDEALELVNVRALADRCYAPVYRQLPRPEGVLYGTANDNEVDLGWCQVVDADGFWRICEEVSTPLERPETD